MSIDNNFRQPQHPTSGTGPQGNGSDAADAKEMAMAAKEQGATVAHSAVDAGKEVAHEASAQVSAVADQTKEQLSAVMGQAKQELSSQLDQRSQQAVAGLRTLSGQLAALTEGRPQAAGQVGSFLREAQQRVQSYTQTLEQRGPRAAMDDVVAFARRRPMSFLMIAGAVGFAAGRLTRAGVAEAKEHSGASNGTGASNGNGYRSNTSMGSGAYPGSSDAPSFSAPQAMVPAAEGYQTGVTASGSEIAR